jgi:uncharacterized phage-associated protein
MIRFCHEHGDCLTNLKLQKLVYYTQAWYLGINGTPLFKDDFQAWIHGPVIPSLYQRFKKFGFNDITEQPPKVSCPETIIGHIQEVLKVYSGYSAYQLEQMTHNEDPWKLARKGIPDDANSKATIKKTDMKVFYAKLAKA